MFLNDLPPPNRLLIQPPIPRLPLPLPLPPEQRHARESQRVAGLATPRGHVAPGHALTFHLRDAEFRARSRGRGLDDSECRDRGVCAGVEGSDRVFAS